MIAGSGGIITKKRPVNDVEGMNDSALAATPTRLSIHQHDPAIAPGPGLNYSCPHSQPLQRCSSVNDTEQNQQSNTHVKGAKSFSPGGKLLHN